MVSRTGSLSLSRATRLAIQVKIKTVTVQVSRNVYTGHVQATNQRSEDAAIHEITKYQIVKIVCYRC